MTSENKTQSFHMLRAVRSEGVIRHDRPNIRKGTKKTRRHKSRCKLLIVRIYTVTHLTDTILVWLGKTVLWTPDRRNADQILSFNENLNSFLQESIIYVTL